MLGYLKVNLIDLIDNKQYNEIANIIFSFSCPYNADVEYFLQNKVIFADKGYISNELEQSFKEQGKILLALKKKMQRIIF